MYEVYFLPVTNLQDQWENESPSTTG